jgi:hypothetical protein
MYLTRAEADAIGSRTAELEARTGTQVVTAVIGKADHYGELPWKAFALGAALAALAVVAFDWLHPDWSARIPRYCTCWRYSAPARPTHCW